MSIENDILFVIQNFVSSVEKSSESALRRLVHLSYEKKVEPLLIGEVLNPLIDIAASKDEFLVRLVYWVVLNSVVNYPPSAEVFKSVGMPEKMVVTLINAGNQELLTQCCEAMLAMSSDRGISAYFVDVGALGALVHVVSDHINDFEIVKCSFRALFRLLNNNREFSFGVADNIIPLCVQVLNESTIDEELISISVQLLTVFTMSEDELRVKLADNGVISLVLKIMDRYLENLIPSCLRLFTNMSIADDIENRILEAGAMPYIIEKLFSDNTNIKNSALKLLANITYNLHVSIEIRHFGWISPVKDILLDKNMISLSEPAVRAIVNTSRDEWTRQLLVNAGLINILQEFQTTEETVIDGISSALSNLNIPISQETIREMDEHNNYIKSQNKAFRALPTPPVRSNVQTGAPVETSLKFNPEDIPRLSKRKTIIKELYDTEVHYVNNLRDIITKIASPIENEKILEETTISELLFQDIKDILVNQTRFLDLLTERIATWDLYSNSGDLFHQFAVDLRGYEHFINMYSDAINLYNDLLMKSPAFNTVMARVTTQSYPTLGKETLLSHFYIQPVQRIPRYRMLMEDLLKNTIDTHPDYPLLTEGLQYIKETAEFLNEARRKAERSVEMNTLKTKITGVPEDFFDAAKRELLREGSITILDKKKSKYQYFFLFSDSLLQTTQSRHHYKLKQMLNLDQIFDITVDKTKDDASKESFIATIVSVLGEYHLIFPTSASRVSWVSYLDNAIKNTQ